MLWISRLVDLVHDEKTCNSFLLRQWGKRSLISGTPMVNRKVSVPSNVTYQSDTLENIIGNKEDKKVIVLSGLSLQEWPEICQDTALASLEKK